MASLRGVLLTILRPRDRAPPQGCGLRGELALIEGEEAEGPERPAVHRSWLVDYDLGLERVERDGNVCRGLRVRPVLARPAESRQVYPAWQAQGFEHPPVVVRHYPGAASTPFPRIGNEPSDDPALFRGRIHLQREGGGALATTVWSSNHLVLAGLHFVILSAQALVHATE